MSPKRVPAATLAMTGPSDSFFGDPGGGGACPAATLALVVPEASLVRRAPGRRTTTSTRQLSNDYFSGVAAGTPPVLQLLQRHSFRGLARSRTWLARDPAALAEVGTAGDTERLLLPGRTQDDYFFDYLDGLRTTTSSTTWWTRLRWSDDSGSGRAGYITGIPGADDSTDRLRSSGLRPILARLLLRGGSRQPHDDLVDELLSSGASGSGYAGCHWAGKDVKFCEGAFRLHDDLVDWLLSGGASGSGYAGCHWAGKDV